MSIYKDRPYRDINQLSTSLWNYHNRLKIKYKPNEVKPHTKILYKILKKRNGHPRNELELSDTIQNFLLHLLEKKVVISKYSLISIISIIKYTTNKEIGRTRSRGRWYYKKKKIKIARDEDATLIDKLTYPSRTSEPVIDILIDKEDRAYLEKRLQENNLSPELLASYNRDIEHNRFISSKGDSNINKPRESQ
jgi:hypothetical protein